MGKSGSARARAGDAAYGAAMIEHELRNDYNGARRRVRNVQPLIWSPYAVSEQLQIWFNADSDYAVYLQRLRTQVEVASENRNFTIMDAYEAHVKGARRSAGAKKLFQHAFIQFPTDLEITSDIEIEMVAQAVAFIQKTYGGNAVFHARLDRDERGRHGVDVFFAPRYAKTTAKGTTDWISLSKFSKKLARDRFGQREKTKKNKETGEFDIILGKNGEPIKVWNDSGYFQGRALQDAFAEHLRGSMKLAWAKRGTRKKTREADWKPPEAIAAERELEATMESIEDAQRHADEGWEAASDALDAQQMAEEARDAANDELYAAKNEIAEARSFADEIRLGAIPEELQHLKKTNKALIAENSALKKRIRLYEDLINSWRETLRRVLGDQFKRVRTLVNDAWFSDPRNPSFQVKSNANKQSPDSTM